MIIFRVDGNSIIGAGHVMRCLSIANELAMFDKDIIFVVSDNSFLTLINKNGFRTIVLNIDYSLLSTDLLFFDVIMKEKPNAVVVDSYFVSNVFFKKIKEHTKVFYLDDIYAFPYDVNVLINYNGYADINKYKKLYTGHVFPHFILGANYAPVRKEFHNVKPFVINKTCRNILVLTGGSDPEHFAIKLLKRIKKEKYNFLFNFVVGIVNPDISEIEKISKEMDNVFLYKNVENMMKLMTNSDIAITAGGSTMYELCACGTPSITYALADNQLPGVQFFNDEKIMLSIGDIRRIINAEKKVLENLLLLSDDYELRCTLSKKMQNFIDGEGAIRLAEDIYNLSTKEVSD